MKKLLLLASLCIYLPLNAQIVFQERASALGVGHSYGDSSLGGGVSFCDFDGDGWDDLTYATEAGSPIRFFRNLGGHFEEIDLGIADTFEQKQVLWVDYDNDGDKDLFATSIVGLNRMYQNNGSLTFKDVTDSLGIFTEDLYSYGAAFGDIDNDGDLDLFITQRDAITRDQYNYLYEFQDGVYTEITESAGLYLGNDLSFCASFFDFDKDGYQDIYVSNDKYTHTNKLYKNNGDNTFTDVSESSGAGMAIDAMSTTIDDYNNDGWLDIYVTNTTAGNYHLRNNGDGTFTNMAETLGTGFYSIAWGAVFLDADNDMDLDLYVSGMVAPPDTRLPSAFYENADGMYSIPANIGFAGDTRKSFANAIGDVNNDGRPDIVVMNDTEPNFLWQNIGNVTNNWIKIRLEGIVSNKDGIGSWIEVFANGQAQYRYTLCGEGYLGQNSGYEFVGLGDATEIDYIKVTWLSGIEDIIENVEINTAIKITEGSGATQEETEDPTDPPPPPEEEPDSEEPPNNDPPPAEEEPETPPEEEVKEESAAEEMLCGGRDMVFYPNPSRQGYIDICSAQLGSGMDIEVFDSLGRQVHKGRISASIPSLDLSNLRSGIYYIRMRGGKDQNYMSKIIKL